MCGFPGVVLALRSRLSTLSLTIIGVVLASMLATGGIGAAAATLTPIAVSFVTPVPGAPGVTFRVYPTPPAFDGQRVVFASQLPSTAFRGLWSAAPDGTGLLGLADDSTPIPGGSGAFGNVFPFRIDNGLVVFFGNDDATQRGYYSVPVTGGPVSLLVNNSTPIPGGPRTST